MDPELKKQAIEKARDHFGKIVADQLDRVEKMKQGEDWLDYSKLKPIIVGIVGGVRIIGDEMHDVIALVEQDGLTDHAVFFCAAGMHQQQGGGGLHANLLHQVALTHIRHVCVQKNHAVLELGVDLVQAGLHLITGAAVR